jgi:hypothetical protein
MDGAMAMLQCGSQFQIDLVLLYMSREVPVRGCLLRQIAPTMLPGPDR